MTTTLSDNLIRSRYDTDAAEFRDEGESGGLLFGHFSVFDTWTQVNSRYEGRFLERIGTGAYTDAFKDKSKLRVMFDHGMDPSIGNKPIAAPDVLRQTERGAYHESPLFVEATYVRDLLPALRAKQLGASFKFRVAEDDQEWVNPRKPTDHNPEMLPERTIRRVSTLYEYGPVPWGQYPEADSGVRSGTDAYLDRLLSDPLFVARFTERAGLTVVERILSAFAVGEANPPSDETVDDQSEEQRTRRIEVIQARLAALRAHSNQGDTHV